MAGGPHHQGISTSKARVEMILRQYRLMHTESGVNWSELGRRSGVHASTARKYVEQHLEEEKQKKKGKEIGE